MTTQQLMQTIPQDRFTPKTAQSAAQKLRKDPRIGQYRDYVDDVKGQAYKVSFWYYEGVEVFEE